MMASGEAQAIPAASHAEFITEHYWGYTDLREGCSEYRVEHGSPITVVKRQIVL